MGPPRSLEHGIVYERAHGINVLDADGNRFVDLAAGFGAMLLGHGHPRVLATVREQSERLCMALGDLYPSTERLKLEQKLLDFLGLSHGNVILGQSGSDAITCALKTAVLATGKPKVLAFTSAYHGLGHAPLALCGLREGYRLPFAEQLSSHVRFLPYPNGERCADAALTELSTHLDSGDVGAVVIEPILGRGGCVLPPQGWLAEACRRTRAAAALFVADEIWTGLGRAGSRSYCLAEGVTPDLLCFGKGLGGGLPISACVGSAELLRAWQRQPEVVHTATFAGAALASASASTTLDVLSESRLPERALEAGSRWLESLRTASLGRSVVADVRGRGFMIGVDFHGRPGLAVQVMFRLLERGYIVSTGGGVRDVMILTPPLTTDDVHREPFVAAFAEVLEEVP
jgi:4-aminobutyrate aminotransferase/(S)-3-amino-2-methylpropionate transaminase